MAIRSNIEIVFQTKDAKKAEDEMTRLGKSSGKTKVQVKGLGAQWNIFKAGLGIALFRQVRMELQAWASPIVEAQRKIDMMRNSMTAATGSAAGAADSMRFAADEADRLGLDLAGTTTQFARFTAASRGSGIAGEELRDVFTQVAQAGRVLSLSGEQVQGAFTAIEQIMSKGKTQAEELRGKLG